MFFSHYLCKDRVRRSLNYYSRYQRDPTVMIPMARIGKRTDDYSGIPMARIGRDFNSGMIPMARIGKRTNDQDDDDRYYRIPMPRIG